MNQFGIFLSREVNVEEKDHLRIQLAGKLIFHSLIV